MSPTNHILRIALFIFVPILAFAQSTQKVYGKIEYTTLIEDNPRAFFIDTIEEFVKQELIQTPLLEP